MRHYITILAAISAIASFGAVNVQTAKLSTLPGKTMVVTNITGAASVSDVPTDSTVAGWGYIKSWTETDPTVPSWAKATTKPSYTWNEIGSKPTTFTPSAHSHVSDSWFTEALSGKLDQPGATVASAALEYHADGQAISVSVAAAGTLTAVVNSWTDGQSQMAFVTLAAGASIAPAIKLIGYSEWPIGEEFMAVCTKRGSKIYVNPVCVTKE